MCAGPGRVWLVLRMFDAWLAQQRKCCQLSAIILGVALGRPETLNFNAKPAGQRNRNFAHMQARGSGRRSGRGPPGTLGGWY